VTKGDSPTRAIIMPLIAPIRHASTQPAAIGSTSVAYGTAASTDPPTQRMTIIVQTATSAHTAPTDRSMPPVMITTVMPSDMIAM
jgi:hypothetical protein